MTQLKEVFFLNEAVERRLGLARAVKLGQLVFISGTVSVDRSGRLVGEGDMRAQLRTVYDNLRLTLEHFGARLGDVVKETIFTTNMPEFLAAADVRANFYRDSAPPATTGVQVSGLAMPGLLVEIEAVAGIAVR